MANSVDSTTQPTLSPAIPGPGTLDSSEQASGIEGKTDEVSTSILKQKPDHVLSSKIRITFADKIIAFFKKIAEIFRRIFCSYALKETPPEKGESKAASIQATAPEPIPTEKWLKELDLHHLRKFDPFRPATFIGFRRASLEKVCQVSAIELGELQAALPSSLPHGIQNVGGNNCYMNAAVQNLIKLFFDSVDMTLIDLKLGTNELLEDFEERSLKKWNPISPLKTDSSRFDKKERYDKILFKWSFLLLVKAYTLGTEDMLTTAMTNHRQVCFTIQRHGDFYPEVISQQMDITSYLTMWHDLLDIKFDWQIYRTAEYKKKTCEPKCKPEPRSLIQLPIPDQVEELSFMRLLKEGLSAEEPNDVTRFTLGKEEVVPEKISTYEHFSSNPPETLTFSYNRFKRIGEYSKKIESKIPLGFNPNTQLLDLRDLFVRKETLGRRDASYLLTGVGVHSGSCSGGHYVAYIRIDKNGWYSCNDSSIKSVKLAEVPFENAYILTFKKVK